MTNDPSVSSPLSLFKPFDVEFSVSKLPSAHMEVRRKTHFFSTVPNETSSVRIPFLNVRSSASCFDMCVTFQDFAASMSIVNSYVHVMTTMSNVSNKSSEFTKDTPVAQNDDQKPAIKYVYSYDYQKQK